MDIVFQPSGNFDEVYLYEELMEADLHAIVSLAVITRLKPV
jgi:mitogen-activated protein kinase 7